MELYFGIMTLTAIFFVFDSIRLRINRSYDEGLICELGVDLDDSYEANSQLEEEVRKWKANYKSMWDDKNMYEKLIIEEYMTNFKEGDGEKIDAILKRAMSENKFSKIKNKKDELHLMSGSKKQGNTTKKNIK